MERGTPHGGIRVRDVDMSEMIKFGGFLIGLTTGLLLIYRLLYYYGSPVWALPLFGFLGAFALVFAMVLAIGVVLIVSGLLRNIYLDIIVFIVVWLFVSYYATGFLGVK